jgi:hypothetical protein
MPWPAHAILVNAESAFGPKNTFWGLGADGFVNQQPQEKAR